MEIDLGRFREAFFEEAQENVATIESTLLELEQVGGSRELLDQVFRAAHSIKGGSGTFGLDKLQRFTHSMESLLDPLREGKIETTGAVVALLLRASDALGRLLRDVRGGEGGESVDVTELVKELDAVTKGEAQAAPEAPLGLDMPASPEPSGPGRYEISFTPDPELFQRGLDPVLLLRDLGSLGEVVSCRLDASALPPLDEIEPERCYLSWKLELVTPQPAEAVRDVFSFVEDTSRIEIVRSGAPPTPAAVAETASGAGLSAPPPPVAASAPSEGQSSEAQRATPPAERAAPGAERTARAPQAAEGQQSAAKNATLRVSADKLDQLVNLVGELVIAQAAIKQALDDSGGDTDGRLREALGDMERHTRELQERVLSVRMVPVSTIFSRFHRLVRDLGQTLGKRVALAIDGGDTEIDKGIIEQLADPLTHLIRNSMDHGVEGPDERRAAGKPEQAVIRLSAHHQSGSVVIEVADDGRGINRERVRAKAVSQGLIKETDVLTPEQINELIFAPGFSTAAQVTDISGRGVGMDVVRRNVDALSGSLTLHSEFGRGATVRIKLPLTLAIVDGLLLRIGTTVFVLPLLAIIESFRPQAAQLKTVFGSGELVRVRGEPIPIVRLYESLGVVPEHRDPCQALVVVVEAGGTKWGLLVDEILGQSQVVAKSLETNYRKVDGVLGATILGDGKVAFILDTEALARRISAGRARSAPLSRHHLGDGVRRSHAQEYNHGP